MCFHEFLFHILQILCCKFMKSLKTMVVLCSHDMCVNINMEFALITWYIFTAVTTTLKWDKSPSWVGNYQNPAPLSLLLNSTISIQCHDILFWLQIGKMEFSNATTQSTITVHHYHYYSNTHIKVVGYTSLVLVLVVFWLLYLGL